MTARISAMGLQALEQRIMFDAALVATAVASEDAHAGDSGITSDPVVAAPLAAPGLIAEATDADPGADTALRRQQLVFVDAKVRDANALLQNLDAGAEVIFLTEDRDGLAQIAELLARRQDLDAIVIVAEGSQANLWLGDTYLDTDSLNRHADELAVIGRSIKAGGDVLLYSCDLAAGADGMRFVQSLASLSGADVAASTNHMGLGSDWTLEYSTGAIEATSPFSSTALADYQYSLATLTVTTNADSGAGSLRQAIADSQSGDTITFSSGMSIALSSGQLSIGKSLTIDGDLNNDGVADVTIDANYTSRVLSVTTGNVTLDGLVLREGLVSGDGGTGNPSSAGGDALGGGIYNQANLTLRNVTVTASGAAGGGGGGGNSGGFAAGGGGGGGGLAGTGGGAGGNGLNASGSYAGVAGGSGVGGHGGGDTPTTMGGSGGDTGGGAGGVGVTGFSNGGAGGTANNGSLSIGGGGGGSGWDAVGSTGGAAAGGIYNAVGATLYVTGSSLITNNVAAGGGGGGGSGTASNNLDGGAGGRGVGGIWNAGTLHMTSATYAAMSGNVGGSGAGGLENGTGVSGNAPAASNDVYNTGTLDTGYTATAPTFNIGDGIVNTDMGSATHRDYPTSLLVQADGKLIVVGHAGYQFVFAPSDVAAVRYNADGSLDTSFGTGGKVLWDALGISDNDSVTEARLLADGKILIVGNTSFSNCFLARLNSDGTPDASFGTGGAMQIVTAVSDGADSVMVMADGSYLIAGTAQGSYEDFALIHVLANGSLDPAFGTNGELILDMNALAATGWGGSSDSLYGVTLQADGKIVAVGRVGSGPYLFQTSIGAVVRWNADGSLDTSFGGGDGVAEIPLAGAINPTQVEVLASGKLLVSGISYQTAFLARFNSDGSVDTAFGPNGTGVVSGVTGDFEFDMFALQADGSIILAGSNGFVSRYSAGGILDTSFGTNGTFQTGLEYVSGVSVLSNGKIVVAGSLYGQDVTPVWAETTNDFALVQLNADGSFDTGFGAGSTLANSLTSFTENGSPVTLDGNVRIYDAEMGTADNYAGASVILQRHGGADADDVFWPGHDMSALTQGASLTVLGVNIGTVTRNSGGVLTLSFNGAATQNLVNITLQQIQYSNTDDTPPTSVQIDWTFSDGSLSTTDSTTVQIGAVNDLPVVTTPATLNFTEDVPGAITGISIATDPDGTAYSGTPNLYLSVASGSIAATSSGGISVSQWSSSALTLWGSQTDINAFIAAGNVVFTPDLNSTADVALSITFNDTAGAGQNSSTTLTITPVDDQPVSFAGGVLAYTENGAVSPIDTGITLTDADSSTLAGVTVSISAGFTSGDELAFTDTASITGSYDGNTGVLTLTGSADFATYQAALRTVGYRSTSENPTAGSASRTITWSIPATGGAVEVTSTINITAVNDAPTVSAGAASAALIEAGGVANGTAGTSASSITLTKGDVDGTASFDTAYLLANGWSTSNAGVSYTKAGTYGTATFTVASGVVGYALNDSLSATEALTQGQSVTDSFTIQVTDGSATQTTNADFAITGRNDAPTVTVGAASATVVEAGGVANATAGTSASSITLTKGDVDGSASFDTAYLLANGWSTSNAGVSYTKAGTYGTATFTVASGVVAYALNDGLTA